MALAALACIVLLLATGCASTYRPSVTSRFKRCGEKRNPGAMVPQGAVLRTVPSLQLSSASRKAGRGAAALAYGVLDKFRGTKILSDGRTTTYLNEIDLLPGVLPEAASQQHILQHSENKHSRTSNPDYERDFESDLDYNYSEPPRIPTI